MHCHECCLPHQSQGSERLQLGSHCIIQMRFLEDFLTCLASIPNSNAYLPFTAHQLSSDKQQCQQSSLQSPEEIC